MADLKEERYRESFLDPNTGYCSITEAFMYLRWFLVTLVLSHLVGSVLPIQAATEITLTKEDIDSDGIQKQLTNPGENQRGRPKQSAQSTADLEVYFMRELASAGHADAQAYLGLMYVTGKNRSYSDAVIWFRKAAAQGNGYGQAGLGWMYAMGRGVLQSDTEAVTWFRKAAEQGNVIGQFNLGMMYLHGIGIPRSDTEAVMWFRKSAEQGNSEAILLLCVMDAQGRQSETDPLACLRKSIEPVIAAMWQTGPRTLYLNYQSLERRGKP
ncbi:MAG: sel1 repeat family protein [Nitrospira sp.]|nr:sel1 repeat family protein [Nitrospira sp.]